MNQFSPSIIDPSDATEAFGTEREDGGESVTERLRLCCESGGHGKGE